MNYKIQNSSISLTSFRKWKAYTLIISPPTKQLWRLKVSDCDPQNNSPFFSIICPEIRNQIFEFILQPVEHLANEEALIAKLKARRNTNLGGERSSCTIYTALLRTCRLVYVEWRELPVWNWEHEFYGSCVRCRKQNTLQTRRDYSMFFLFPFLGL